jgi:hypothetical protein
MDDFISEDDLLTFEGYLRYQAVDSAALTPEELKMWRDIFEEVRLRCASTPKVGLMKLQPVPEEQKYAVAIRKKSDLWLTLWVRYSKKGEVFIMYPRGDSDWDAHASYHLDGTLHQKSYGRIIGATLKRQPLTGAFKGSEHLGMYGGHGTSNGAVCDPAVFTRTVIVESGVPGPRHGVVAIDLVEPGCEPMPFFGKQIVREVFPRQGRPSVVITIGYNELTETAKRDNRVTSSQ